MDSTSDNSEKNFLEQSGLKIATGDVEVGMTYPIYGMITKILEVEGSEVRVEINFNIVATMEIPDSNKVENLRSRAFEPGIFVARVDKVDEKIEVSCSTVIFGKRIGYHD